MTLVRYFTFVGLENTCTRNLNYNYYILQDLDCKVYTWIMDLDQIVIYLTGFGLENTWTMNLGKYYSLDIAGFGFGNTWTGLGL